MFKARKNALIDLNLMNIRDGLGSGWVSLLQRKALIWRITGRDYPDEILQVMGLVDYDMNVLFRWAK